MGAVCFLVLAGILSWPRIGGALSGIQLTGTVTDPSGNPVQNVSVYATDPGSSAVDFGPVSTGSNGAYELDVDSGTYDLHFDPPSGSGLNPIVENSQSISSNQTINIQFAPTEHAVSGTITDDTNAPVSGISVNLSDPNSNNAPSVVTDSSGHYSITTDPTTYNMTVRINDTSQIDGPSINLSTGDITQNLQIPSTSASLHVVAKDSSGNLLSSAHVELFSTQQYNSLTLIENNAAQTDGSGEASFSRIFNGMVFAPGTICVNFQQFCNTDPVTVGTDDLTVTVQQPGNHAFSGTLRDTNGLALANTTVSLLDQFRDITSTQTDGSGHFSITEPSGVYTVLVREDGTTSTDIEGPQVDLQTNDVSQDLQVPPTVAMNVIAKDQSGNPLNGTTVSLNSSMPLALFPGGTNNTNAEEQGAETTDESGTATFPKVFEDMVFAPGTICVNFQQFCNTTQVTVGDSSLTITVQEPGSRTFSGTLRDTAGSVLTNTTVDLLNQTTRDITSAQTDNNGHFSFAVNPDIYSVSVRIDNTSSTDIENPQVDLRTNDVSQDLQVPPTVALHVLAKDQSGNPISGTQVIIQSSIPLALYPGGTANSSAIEQGGFATDGSGEVTFPKVFEGMVFAPGTICVNFQQFCNLSTITIGSNDVTIVVQQTPPAPASPTNLTSSSFAQNPQLSWGSVSGATFYNIYRDGSLIDTISADNTTYADNTAPEGNDSYYVTAKNGGGESGPSNTISVLVDRTVPTITYTISPTPNSAGWNNGSPVTVTFNCSDGNGSGIAACSSPQTENSDGTYFVTGTATDNAGNTSSINTTVNLDQTAPVLGTPSWSANPVVTGSNTNINVPVTDNLSGVTAGEYFIGGTDPGQGNSTQMTFNSGTGSLTATLGSSLSPGTYTINFRAEDTAGNWSAVTSSSLTVNPPIPTAISDLTAASPVQTPTLSWSSATNATSYNVYRNGSKIGTTTNTTYTDSTAPEGSDGYYVTAADSAGESGQSNNVSVLVDRTVPTITYSINPTPNSNGWNNSVVTVTFTCADNATGPSGSGIATCTPPQTESSDGTYTVTGTAVDNAGNSSSVSATVKIDLTTPLVGTASWSTNPVVTGNSTTLTVPATPADGSPITGGEYYIGSTDPGQGNGTAMTYDSSTGNLTANMPTSLAPGSYQVHVRAQIAADTWSSTTSTTLVVKPVPVAPAITSANSYSIGVRQIITPSDFTFTATGTPTPDLSETGTLPSGLNFTNNGDGTANFTGMVAAGTAGSYPITIKATSSAGTITQTFTLTITNTNSAPTTIFTSTGSNTINASVGVSTSFTFTATGNSNNAKIFVYSGALPAGLNLHDNKDGTASVTGTPTQAGTYTFTVEAQNKQGVTYQQFTVIVN